MASSQGARAQKTFTSRVGTNQNDSFYPVQFNSIANSGKQRILVARKQSMPAKGGKQVSRKYLRTWRSNIEVGVKQSHLLHDIEQQILQREA